MADSSTGAGGVSFKGRMMTLTVVEIRETDLAVIARQIDAQLARAPAFFDGMPVLLSLPGMGPGPDLAELAAIVRDAGLVAVGLLDADEKRAAEAKAAGLGLVRSPARGASGDSAPPPAASDESATAAPMEQEHSPRTPTRLVTRPVRSGQQIYARGGDLVIAASVSEGAEVLADGHIHIYGALRGRALAGATGDVDARIYCRRFEPDLVAVAGCYKVADAIEDDVRGQAVSIRLEHDNLLIELQE